MAKNVNRTARMQWKVDTIKNCIYLPCGKMIITQLTEKALLDLRKDFK